jgi:transcription antitermination factor NusG
MQSLDLEKELLSISQMRMVPGPQLHWYAVQTCARHEKRVHQRFIERSVESFFPLYDTISRWKDRKVRVQLPLFPGYIFVHLDLAERLNVLQVAGVARFVTFGGVATRVPTTDIESLRAGLLSGLRVEPFPFLKVGRLARVISGPLQGMIGILLRKKNLERFIISLELIQRSVSVDIDAVELEPVAETRTGRTR